MKPTDATEGAPAPPVLWSTIITRWAVVVLLVVVVIIALRPAVVSWIGRTNKFHTTGDKADIRLVGIAPDGEDVLYDPLGRRITAEKLAWPGERTMTWAQQEMHREFLFELGPGAEGLDFPRDDAGSIGVTHNRGWVNSSSVRLGEERVVTGGRPRILLRANLSQTYWSRGFFGGSQHLFEEADVTLNYYAPQRARAWAEFNAPFKPGVTNRSLTNPPAFLMVVTNKAETAFRVWGAGYQPYARQIVIYDDSGKRHFPVFNSSQSGPFGWTNEFFVPGLPFARVAGVTLGEPMRSKTFHNVVVGYAGHTGRAYSPVLDRLAVALGKTNTPAQNLEHYSPRNIQEAMTVLEFRPGSQSALNVLAHSDSTTNYSELTPAQREVLRKTAARLIDGRDSYRRGLGLRIGLRGGWPEFPTLALTHLNYGSVSDRANAVHALAAHPKSLGPEHVPLLVGLARTNEPPGLSSTIIGLIRRAGGPAATNALVELAHADEPWLWWMALGSLPQRHFQPIDAQPEELQQRFVLVFNLPNAPVSAATRAAANARLPGLLTPAIRDMSAYVFGEVLNRVTTRLDRATAMAAMMDYLRAGDVERWKHEQPMSIVRQVNAWYGQDFGGIGDGTKRNYTAPERDAWPGIIEDVLEFHERLKRDGKLDKGKQ